MYRKYYSYSDMPQMIPKKEPEKRMQVSCGEKVKNNDKILGKFENDDVLLAVIIIALLLDDGADSMLILALAAVFLSGLI